MSEPEERLRSQRGFTLIEVLLATSLLAVIGLAIAETLRVARTADKKIKARAERRAQDRAVLERLERDLRAIAPMGVLYPQTGGQPSGTGTVAGTFANVNLSQNAPQNMPLLAGVTGTLPLVGIQNGRSGGEALSLGDEETAATTAAAQVDASATPAPFDERDTLTIAIVPGARRIGSEWPTGTGSIQTILWAIDDDPSTVERGLIRRPLTVQNAVSTNPEPCEVVCSDACGLMFRYFDGQGNWSTSWDCGANGQLPFAIEVSVAIRDPDEKSIRRIVTVVSPLTARMLPGTSTPSGTPGPTLIQPVAGQ
jgi:prepilin-type N-terminal cleavage/methylation domain-containing protein